MHGMYVLLINPYIIEIPHFSGIRHQGSTWPVICTLSTIIGIDTSILEVSVRFFRIGFRQNFLSGIHHHSTRSLQKCICDWLQENRAQRGGMKKKIFLTYRFFDGRRSISPSLRAVAPAVGQLCTRTLFILHSLSFIKTCEIKPQRRC